MSKFSEIAFWTSLVLDSFWQFWVWFCGTKIRNLKVTRPDMAESRPENRSREPSGRGDPVKEEKLRKILSGLESPHSQNVYRCLVDIRTKYATGDYQKSKALVSLGLVGKLIPLLERPNSKIVDVALSILGNLTLHRKPREKVCKIFRVVIQN